MQTIEHDGKVTWFKPPVSIDEMLYLTGATKPHYPMPVDERTNAIAMPIERVTFRVKRWLLAHWQND